MYIIIAFQPRKWVSIPLKSPGIKPRRQNNSTSSAINNGTINASNIVQTLTTRPHSFIPVSEVSGGDQFSPSNSISNISNIQNGTNAQAFSVFANVNIPERNGAKWTSSSANSTMQQAINTIPSMATQFTPANLENKPLETNEIDEAPLLPKKPNSASSLQAAFSPTFGDTASGSRLDTVSLLSEDYGMQQSAYFLSNRTSSSNQTGNDTESLHSPLPRVVVSPLREIHSTSNRSPFHCATSSNKSTYNSSSHIR